MQHLLFASFGMCLIASVSYILRRVVKRDAVIQYWVQATMILLAALMFPVQWLACYMNPPAIVISGLAESWRVGDSDAAAAEPEAFIPSETHESSLTTAVPRAPLPGLVRESPASRLSESPAGWIDRVSESALSVVALGVAETVYRLGVAVLVVLVTLRILATFHLILRCQPLDDRQLSELCAVTVGPGVKCRQARSVRSPSCLMLPYRMIVLPDREDWGLSLEHVRCVLQHEAVHLERCDWLMGWVQEWLKIALWFHPLVWWMSRRFDEDRELSCDAIVVRNHQNAKTYANAVLACCEPSHGPRWQLIAGFDSSAGLRRRFEMLAFADQKTSHTKIVLTVLGTLFAISVATAIQSTVMLAAPPRVDHAKRDTHVEPDGTATVDDDNDGLSNFAEKHKYLTDPDNADTDGDGIPDGDWNERREYQYTIRSVVQVMRPVTAEFLNDAFQDVKILDATEQYVELEVFHYPFNTVASTIQGDPNWRRNTASMRRWVRPGPSSDWTPEMQSELKRQLSADGIDIDRLDDRQIVEQVSKWLCDRAAYVDGFTTFITGWDDSGNPYIPDGFDEAIARELKKSGLTLEQHWQREVSAKGMFHHKTHGSCTSSAIYLNGCLKAMGIPTRTVYCIPIIDASDEREFDLLRNVKQPAVRSHLVAALRGLKQSWSSHTLNEVYVGGQWHRLNYSHLGQGIYDRKLFGLMTHIGTFNDWADAKAHETIGRRQRAGGPRDVFGYNNPYSTISLRDEMGPHCKIELPKLNFRPHVVERIFWTDDEALPKTIRENCERRDRFGFIAQLSGVESMDQLRMFLDQADLRVFLEPSNKELPVVKIGFDKGCIWVDGDQAMIYVPFGPSDIHDLEKNAEYAFVPRDQSAAKGFPLSAHITAVRQTDLPDIGPDLRKLLPIR